MDRGLAYIGRIQEIDSIPGADFLELATVVCGEGGKWHGVVKKGDFVVGSLCRVFLPDAKFPEGNKEFEFMEKFGWRVKQQKFRGCPSEVVILPNRMTTTSVGDDITVDECISKYERPLPPTLAGFAIGSFPTFLSKTDEPNFQGAWRLVDALQGQKCYISTKVDGSSGTAYYYDGHFGVCSRNLELKETEGNSFWFMVNKYGLREKFVEYGKNIAIQFELAGPGIQANPLNLKELHIYVFNLYNIDQRKYEDFEELDRFTNMMGLPLVTIEAKNIIFPKDISSDALQKLAEGTYPTTSIQREGIVIRPMQETLVRGQRLSFKVINLKYRS